MQIIVNESGTVKPFENLANSAREMTNTLSMDDVDIISSTIPNDSLMLDSIERSRQLSLNTEIYTSSILTDKSRHSSFELNGLSTPVASSKNSIYCASNTGDDADPVASLYKMVIAARRSSDITHPSLSNSFTDSEYSQVAEKSLPKSQFVENQLNDESSHISKINEPRLNYSKPLPSPAISVKSEDSDLSFSISFPVASLSSSSSLSLPLPNISSQNTATIISEVVNSKDNMYISSGPVKIPSHSHFEFLPPVNVDRESKIISESSPSPQMLCLPEREVLRY